MDPYERFFEKETTEEENEELKNLNRFMQNALGFLNEGKTPDVEALVAKYEVDPRTAAKCFLSQ